MGRSLSLKKIIPNALTVGRLLAAPLMVYLLLPPTPHFATALVVLGMASISDFWDGFLARRWQTESLMGAYLDPLADKMLVMAVFTMLTFKGLIPLAVCCAIIFRDCLILAGVAGLRRAGKNLTIHPLFISKLNTGVQLVFVCWGLGMAAWGIGIDAIRQNIFFQILAGLTLVTTLWSGLAYGYKGWRLWQQGTVSKK
jgi:cardiolipin synthase